MVTEPDFGGIALLPISTFMKFRILPLAVAAGSLLVGCAASVQALSLRSDIGSQWEPSSPTPVTEEGNASALAAQAAERLASESLVAMRLVKEEGDRRVILESSSFRRGSGAVVGKGVFWDGGGPREIRMFLDAYGAGPLPIASFPFDFQSTGGRQPIEARIEDYTSFQRFAFRFTHDGVTLDIAPKEYDGPRVSGVTSDAMLFHSDYGELRTLLDQAGYLETKSFEPSAMMGAVRRFRADRSLPGPGFVSLGDLFALRIATGMPSGPTSLVPYIEWASGSEGGRMEKREVFEEPVLQDEEENPAADEIYEDMDPPAERDMIDGTGE